MVISTQNKVTCAQKNIVTLVFKKSALYVFLLKKAKLSKIIIPEWPLEFANPLFTFYEQDPILLILNLKLQSQRCGRARFLK
jgi:hypothetical protein